MDGKLDRRRFLTEPAMLAGAVAVAGSLPVAALAQGDGTDFAWLAGFLTGKADLPDPMVVRALEALRATGSGMDARLTALAERIRAAKFADIEAFRASPLAADKALVATAVLVIRAFYTGRVGTGARSRYVGFEDALMFRPTSDVTTVPTFSRRPPNYWVDAPR